MALLLLHCIDAPTEIGEPIQDAATGALLCPAFAATETIALYQGADGRQIREYVSPQSLRDMAHLSARKPMTNDHPPDGVWVDASNYHQLQVGETGDDDGYLSVPEDAWGGAVRAKVAIKPTARRADVIADIRARRKLGVSAGYTKEVDETPGTHPHLGDYDRVRTHVTEVNHFAFCEQPRLEGSVLLGFDSVPPVRETPMIPKTRAELRAFLRSADGRAALAKLLHRKGTTDSAGKVLEADAMDYGALAEMAQAGMKDKIGAILLHGIVNMAAEESETAAGGEEAPIDEKLGAEMGAMREKVAGMDAALSELRAQLAVVRPTLDGLRTRAEKDAADATAARLARCRTVAKAHGLVTADTATEAQIVAHFKAKGIGTATDSDDAVIARAEERLVAPAPRSYVFDAAPTLIDHSEA